MAELLKDFSGLYGITEEQIGINKFHDRPLAFLNKTRI